MIYSFTTSDDTVVLIKGQVWGKISNLFQPIQMPISHLLSLFILYQSAIFS